MACFTNVPVVSYAIPKEEEDDDGGEILGGTGYGRWGRLFLFSKSTLSYDTDTAQNCSPFWYCSIATKSDVTRLLAIPLDTSDVFLMTFMILQDSYMEPTRVGSDSLPHQLSVLRSDDGTGGLVT